MGLAGFMAGVYNHEEMSDKTLMEMRNKINHSIILAGDLMRGDGFIARSARKDFEKLAAAKERIDAEIKKRGLDDDLHSSGLPF